MIGAFPRSSIAHIGSMNEGPKVRSASCKTLIAGHGGTCKFHLRLLVCSSIPLLLAISTTGCQKSSSAVPVHGSISLHGQPLASGSVTFFPKTGRPIGAAVSNGEYKTQLMPDEYTVTLDVAPEFPKGFKEGDPLPTQKVTIPEEYTSRAKSTLKASVKAGQSEPVDFDLK
jgi:hypothetical protein